VDLGKEMRAVTGAKQARIAHNEAKHQDKMDRHKQSYEAGMKRAKNGVFKKGNK